MTSFSTSGSDNDVDHKLDSLISRIQSLGEDSDQQRPKQQPRLASGGHGGSSRPSISGASGAPGATASGAAGESLAAARQALAGTQIIYMAANQIPLLDLRDPAEIAGLAPAETLDRLRRAITPLDTLGAESADMKAVAFTDPNDLLSYELDTADDRNVNVRITIASVLFFYFANPWEAHTGYLESEKVWQYIACGSDRECNGD